ncbi:polysaccharide biosynthesis tyrosine autokinase [Castellaniella sp.]|uniref:polysaccharide biosynthesis tyrosine autokinase n=1 Tax=Castellaniella sp. TaxID=1955812 RepID=UPI00355E56D5
MTEKTTEEAQLARRPIEDDDEINLGELFNVLVQRRWLVAGIFGVLLVAGMVYALLATPIYQADALIQVESRKSAGLGGLTVLSDTLGFEQSPVSTELEILRSREVLMTAIKKTQANMQVQVEGYFPFIGRWLARRNEARYPGELAPAVWGMTSYAWGGELLRFALLDVPPTQWGATFYLVATGDGQFDVLDDDDNVLGHGRVGERTDFYVGGEQAVLAVAELRGRIGTRFLFTERSPLRQYKSLSAGLDIQEVGKGSSIIRLQYESADDAFAVSIVNAVAQAYLEQNVERRTAEARSSLKFLETQLPDLKRQMDAAEDALSSYRTSSNTIAVDKEAEILLNRSVQMENRRLELRLKRDELLQRFTAAHPDVKNLDKQMVAIEEASRKIDAEIDRLPKAQRELLPFERDARVNTTLYMSLLNNAQELRVAEAGTIGNVRIIDYALPSEQPVKPKKALAVAISAALGLFLGILAAFLAYFLRPAAQRPEQLEGPTGLSTYVTIPESDAQLRLDHAQRRGLGVRGADARSSHGTQLLALQAPHDPAVESLRSLRTGLSFALMGAPGRVIAITGATSGVGKSFIAANFATLLASTGKKVVLVDCDLRRPRLHTYFSYARKAPGLSGVLAGDHALAQVLLHESEAGLSVLPSGLMPPNPGELLLSPRFGELIKALEAQFDLVVLDTPPVLPVADTLAILQHATAAFIVARAEQSTPGELVDAMGKLRHSGVAGPVRGILFNAVKRNRIGYGAGYKYYYSYR